MIHVATVHWRSNRWIDPQLHYLDRLMPGPFRVYAFLDRISGDHHGRFFYTCRESITDHAKKLDLLGELIFFAAEDPSDPLVFIDGDAFPVAPIGPLIEERLERHRLIAVQRLENNGALQPHPCFCITTVGFWQDLRSDWHRGAEWLDSEGVAVTDVGGNLLAALEEADVDWYPLRRMNTVDAHRLFFGLYGDAEHGALIYHHGSGFRTSAGGRVSRMEGGERRLQRTVRFRAARVVQKVGPLRDVGRRMDPVRNLRDGLRAETRRLGDEVFAELQRDDEFWRRFLPADMGQDRGCRR